MHWIEDKQLLMMTVFDALIYRVPARWLRVPLDGELLEPESYKTIDDSYVRFMLPVVLDDGAIEYIGYRFEDKDFVFSIHDAEYLAAIRIDSAILNMIEWDLPFIKDKEVEKWIIAAWDKLSESVPRRSD